MSTKATVIILTLAARSAGVVTRAELLGAGVAEPAIDRRLQRGTLARVWPGLYEVPELESELTPLFRAVKAVPGSVLSHLSAARGWGFAVPAADPGDPVHVTVRRARCRSELPGIVVHRTRRLDEGDVRPLTDSLPSTSPARTILDLADPRAGLGDHRLGHVIEGQLVTRRSIGDELSALLDRPGQRGVPGAARFRRILVTLLDDQPLPESALERRFAHLLREHGVAGFERQVRPPWYDGRRGTVDFAHRAAEVIVEIDGRRWHSTGQAMTDDRRRDRLAALHGWLVLRITGGDLADRPSEVVEHVSAALVARGRGHGVEAVP